MYKIMQFIIKKNRLVKYVILLGFLFSVSKIYSQTDTEFWFSVPEINRYHTSGTDSKHTTRGGPTYLRLTAGKIGTRFWITMPANTANFNGGNAYTDTIPPNSTKTIDLLTLKFVGDDNLTPPFGEHPLTSMENRLCWTTSDIAVTTTKKYINKNNKGIYIKSRAPITAYYEISSVANMELLALKGKNALGKEFYVPFQTTYPTTTQYTTSNHQYRPYSSFDIVATEDNTEIQITVPQAVFVYPGQNLSASTFTIWLNKGETAIIPPYANLTDILYKVSRTNRLSGANVKVISGGNIAIITRDDMVMAPSGNVDFVGDQIVPIDLLGLDYAVVRGRLKSSEEYAYVIGTEASTAVTVNGVSVGTVNAGATLPVQIPSTKPITTIHADKPIYVYHLSGFTALISGSYYTQFAGAIIPTITVCTGSSQVAFNRTKASTSVGYYDFYLNILVRDGAETSFSITDKNGNDATSLIPGLNTSSSYTLVGSTDPFDKWRYASFNANSIVSGADEAYLIKNSKDVFHLGILNGYGGYDAFYGYFSDFNAFDPSSYVIGTGSAGTKECYGNDVQLFASGGTTYSWSPTDFLDDPQSDVPIAYDVRYSVDYKVTISGACGFKADRIVKMFVSDYISPAFSPDKFSACATKALPADTAKAAFTFTDESTGDYYRKWFYRSWNKVTNTMNPWVEFKSGNDADADPAKVVSFNFPNTTSDTIRYYIMLEVADNQEICFKTVINSVVVYPYINLSPSFTVTDPNHCQPLLVNFQTNPTGNYGSAYYHWDFGDGGSSASPTPSHTYSNFATSSKTFTASATLTDQWNYCSVTKTVDVDVQPYLDASFVIDDVDGCSPFSTGVVNDSKGGITQYDWDKNGDGVYESSGGSDWTYSRTNSTGSPESITLLLRVRNAGGCTDVAQRTVTINPRATASITSAIVGDAACSPLDVNFTATTTNADEYHWLFGINAVDNITTTSYTFENYGSTPTTQAVTFTANNQWGCSASAGPINITVNPYVEAVLAIDDEEGCSPHTVALTNASSAGSSVFQWDIYNDGSVDYTTKNIANQTYTYPTGAGWDNSFTQYTVPIKLTAQNSAGCTSTVTRTVYVNPQATSSFTYYLNGNTNACSPVDVDFDGTYTNTEYYQWQFGDLGAATIADPSFTLTNTSTAVKPVQVDLVASNRFGCNAPMFSQIINVQPEIKAEFSLSNAAGCAPLTYTIAAPPTAGTYTWDINGVTSTGDSQTITVSDNETGSTQYYNITLIASNGTCADTSAVKMVAVYPEVEAKWSPPDPIVATCSPFNLSITNASTLYSSAAVLSNVFWELTDGGTFNISSIDQSVIQQLLNPGYESSKDYTLTLTARSTDGCSNQKTSTITVNPPVDAAFNVSVIDACTPMRLQVTDASQVKSGTTYFWNWDGGTFVSSAGENYVMEYTNADPELPVTKTVTLNLTNSDGCTDAATYTFSVNPVVVSAFSVDAASSNNVCAPDDIIFNNNSTGGTLSFNWDFGDGTQVNVTNRNDVTHSYENRTSGALTRTVTLTATNSLGCTNATPATIPVTVFPEIVADYTMTIDSICTPVQVSVTNNSLNGTNFIWNFTPTAGGVAKVRTENTFTELLENTLPNSNVTYTVGLTASSTYGAKTCSSTTASRTVTVLPELLLNFDPLPAAVCSDLPINFDNLSSGGTLNYTWDFNDGQSGASSAFDDVQHTFINRNSSSITRNVAVTAVNPKGCTRTQIIPVVVHPKVEAGFVFAQQSQCTPFSLDLTNTSLNGNKYFWTTYFNGDTITRDQNLFPYLFDNNTLNDILTDTIKLVSRDTITGCLDSIRQMVTIYPRVVSQFDIDRVSGCNPLPVAFINNSSGLSTYLWEFGDGATSVETTPAARNFSHVYKDKSQDFTISLTATNQFGCKSLKDTIITVYPLVKADFQWNKFEGCTPLDINLNNSSTSPLYKYSWDFGDGSPMYYAEQPTSHTYTNTTNTPPVIQSPTITLRASYVSDTACVDQLQLPIRVFPHIYPDFTANFEGCHPHDVTITNQTVSYNSSNTYYWNLGNGVNSLDTNPAIQYINTSKTKDSTFSVLLRAISVHGCENSIRHTVTVHPRPFAAMELTGEYISCPPFPVEIDNNSIGTNLTNVYTFGDGSDSTTTSMANMNHEFHNLSSSNTEPYEIELRTVTEFGCDDSISQTVYVYPEVVANYNADPGWEACNPFEITFDNSSINSYFYRWSFDDGVTSSLTAPKHRFTNVTENDRVFDVKLEATSVFDCYDDTVRQVTVWATPVANIAMDPALKKFPDATFTVENQTYPAPDGWSYSWTFGDNTFSLERDPGTHTYLSWAPKSNDYKYDISLVVNSPHCKDSTSTFVYLLPADPNAFFKSNIDSACSPMEVHFINTSLWADSYLWEFGDGTTSTDREPIHTFTEPGYYTVKLTVTGDGGNRFFYRVFRVYQNPTAAFAIHPFRVMLPDATVHGYNLSTDFSRSLWDMGDGTITTDKDPVHTYTGLGNFKVSLWVYMDYGDDVCVDSISKNPAVYVEGTGMVKFPNAFKPGRTSNGGVYDEIDYKNEVFHPYHYGVAEYKLMIFSRWGEQIFTSDDVNIGWDGFADGKPAELGVYMWRAIGKYTNGKTFDIKGSVTLLK
ncbi:hypothetical protein CYCD_02450 [Tenuifilaceae bacterium CYCD]|nr:hypothetical protein CYCD_02450 [Tenuifilaceae bacterium CYCD]